MYLKCLTVDDLKKHLHLHYFIHLRFYLHWCNFYLSYLYQIHFITQKTHNAKALLPNNEHAFSVQQPKTLELWTNKYCQTLKASKPAFRTYRLLICMKTVDKLIIGVRVVVGFCKLINTAIPAK